MCPQCFGAHRDVAEQRFLPGVVRRHPHAGRPRDLLLRLQRKVLEPIARAMEAKSEARIRPDSAAGGFDAILIAWRRATAMAALNFIDMITEVPSATRGS